MAKVEEVDTLEAIRLAANPLKTVTEGDKYLIIADTGVSTTGYVNFCANDLFNTPTEEIIQALEDAKAIPDLTSVHVIWLYAGQVAEPQQALSEAQKDKLIEIWTAILEKAGAASIDFRPDSASSTPYTNLPDVSTVNADDRAIDVTPLTKMILDSESVSFVGDQAVFEDENQAKQAISSVAQTLLAHPDNKVYVGRMYSIFAGERSLLSEPLRRQSAGYRQRIKRIWSFGRTDGGSGYGKSGTLASGRSGCGWKAD